jgi:hypothetical protein
MLNAVKSYTLLTFTTRNHGLFYWKNKPKINHFDIWSIWAFNHIEQADLNMFNSIGGFLIDHKMFFWLVKLDKNLGNQTNLIFKIVQFVNIKM